MEERDHLPSPPPSCPSEQNLGLSRGKALEAMSLLLRCLSMCPRQCLVSLTVPSGWEEVGLRSALHVCVWGVCVCERCQGAQSSFTLWLESLVWKFLNFLESVEAVSHAGMASDMGLTHLFFTLYHSKPALTDGQYLCTDLVLGIELAFNCTISLIVTGLRG